MQGDAEAHDVVLFGQQIPRGIKTMVENEHVFYESTDKAARSPHGVKLFSSRDKTFSIAVVTWRRVHDGPDLNNENERLKTR